MYDGDKNDHCWAIFVWTYTFGKFMRIDVTALGTSHDKKLYDQSPPYIAPAEQFDDDEHLLVDTGFIGDGAEFVVPFKKDLDLDFVFRRMCHPSVGNRIC